jgi:hypothetical protein
MRPLRLSAIRTVQQTSYSLKTSGNGLKLKIQEMIRSAAPFRAAPPGDGRRHAGQAANRTHRDSLSSATRPVRLVAPNTFFILSSRPASPSGTSRSAGHGGGDTGAVYACAETPTRKRKYSQTNHDLTVWVVRRRSTGYEVEFVRRQLAAFRADFHNMLRCLRLVVQPTTRLRRLTSIFGSSRLQPCVTRRTNRQPGSTRGPFRFRPPAVILEFCG